MGNYTKTINRKLIVDWLDRVPEVSSVTLGKLLGISYKRVCVLLKDMGYQWKKPQRRWVKE